MTTPLDSRYRLLVLSLPEDPPSLANLLTDALELNRVDARIQIHRLPGLLKPELDRDLAERLAAQIHDAGGLATLIACDEVPDLSRPTPLHHVRCTDHALEILGLDGRPIAAAGWNELALLNIGLLPLEIVRHESVDTTALHSAPGSKTSTTEVRSMRGPEAWLIAENPFRVWIIKPAEMNYEYLGDRKQTSGAANFRMLIDDIIARAKQLYLAPPARAFTGHGLSRHFEFEGDEELRENTLFHLLIRRQLQTRRGD